MKYYAIGMVLLGLTATAVQADTWTVDDNGKADFDNIQAAVDAASDGDTINVAPGTYTHDTGEVVFMKGKNIILQSTVLHGAVIDGQGTRRGITCTQGEPASTLISGFVIQNCNSGGGGGGLLIDNSSPTISNCRIRNNSANNGGGAHAEYSNSTWSNCEFSGNSANSDGAGAYFKNECDITMTGCTFTGNSGGADGGAIRVYGSSSLDISLSMFDGNSVTGGNARGGAIQVDVESTLNATLCTFNNNQSGKNGGAIEAGEENLTLDQCTFIGNIAIEGGGIFCGGTNPTITNCTFINNVSNNGGGIFCFSGNLTLTDCTFTGNTSEGAGALRLESNSNAVITNCVFNFNSNSAGQHGGAIYAHNSEATFFNCTFDGNIANLGGAIITYIKPIYIDSCIFSNNTASSGGGALFLNSSNAHVSNTVFCNNNPDDWSSYSNNGFIDDGGNTFNESCWLDCNENGIDDIEDIANQTSFDCDQNGVPDECQPDCDGDGWIDACDNDSDIDGDGIPDSCELDCNENSLPDDFEIAQGIAQDCDGNGIPDECDIEFSETLTDCNSNGILDSCEIADDPSLDCNGNGILDTCDIADAVNYEEAVTKLISDDALPSDWLGHSVDVDGDLAVIGAPFDGGNPQGTAYIFRFNGNEWIQEAKLLADDGGESDRFGFSVAISGSKAIVGAFRNDAVAERSGAAYIYAYNGSNWIQEAKLFPSNGDFIDYFGRSVSISGDLAIVGATDHDGPDNNQFERGSAYIFRCNAGVWTEEVELSADDGVAFDYFGFSVSIHGTTAVVGAAYDHNDNGMDAGSVYVYEFNDSTWNESKIISSDGDAWDYFGSSVDIHESTIIVGAWAKDDAQNGGDAGSAYIYHRNDTLGSWDEEAKLTASDGSSNDFFGWSVSVNGNTAVAGVPEYEGGGIASGAAYRYTFDGTQWSDEEVLIADDRSTGDKFGFAVSVSDSVTLAGAYGNDDAGNDAGSAYIFNSANDGTSSIDCDENGAIDSCEIADNPSLDCNGNGALDSCEDFDDCNYNDIPDSCDISDGTSNDVNMNGVPDECESDCNENGIPDDWEIKNGLALDCNENMLPDECDIADGTSTDVNSNDVPDECEDDCNGNGIPDDWDIKTGAALDCNGNGIPDYCDVAAGCDTDCNLNGVPDSCDLASGTSEDINMNNLPDECECIADITNDGVVDIHDLLALIGYWGSPGPIGDFNADGIVKIQDLLILVAGWSECTNIICNDNPPIGAVQWTIEGGGNGHWYMAVSTGSDDINWGDAKVNAMLSGGHLVTFSDINEFEFVKLNIVNDISLWSTSSGGDGDCLCNGPWIGASNQGAGIVQVDGTTFPFTDQTYPWHPENPHPANCCPSVVNFWDYYGSRSLGDHPLDTADLPNSFIVEWSN